jgi:arylsulfatase A-like enzyme
MPLVMRYPGHIASGRTIERVVSFVDLAPTLLEIAGESVPESMQGRSLVRLLKDPSSARHRDECFLEYDEQKGKKYPARGIVTSRYKYIDYLNEPEDVLFDLENDPRERRNVFRDPAHAPALERLRKRLADWRRDTQDPLLAH